MTGDPEHRTGGQVRAQPIESLDVLIEVAFLRHPVQPHEVDAELEAVAGGPADYNRYAEQGDDPDFHKTAKWMKPLVNPPYAALDLSLGKAHYVGFPLGGLRVSLDAQVVRDDGSVIDGLYAVGGCASNIAQDGLGYSSGTCIGEGTYFGRRAGRHVASR